MLAAGIGAICLVNKGAGKLAQLEAPKLLKKWTASADKFLNTNKKVQGMKGKLLKWAGKTPVALKDIGASLLSWSPSLLLFGGLFHSLGTAGRQNREFAENYNNLKNKQEALAKARIRELSVQNDFLMQDAQNREEIALLNNPKTGLEDV